MKRANNLFCKIHDTKNIEYAFYKASKGKRNTKDVVFWKENIEREIAFLKKDIEENRVKTNNYSYFKIYDPKERLISVAPFKVRIYHHAIMNVCHNVFENHQIYHSYATRPFKGTHKAIEQAVKNNSKAQWFLKLDVKKFFDTINHQVLNDLLSKRFKEKEILTMFSLIINGYNTEQKIGLPIGNLTSQYFANYYLSFLDKYAKQDLKIKYYVRYMDDIVVWGNSKKEIWYYFKKLEKFLEDRLLQRFKTPIYNKTTYPYNYLGYNIIENKISPNKRNRVKFNKKLDSLNYDIINNNISEEMASLQFWAMSNYKNFKINTHV